MYHETMQEVAQFQMPSELQQLFATILLFGEPKYHNKSLSEYDLPLLISPNNNLNKSSKLLLNELNISITAKDLSNIELLNENQK
ncbi:9527_t:CDS:2 [Cetraspora pellucida]|uniref:9527_t:CDS:1 n=1 Tax=Cetraspora pellucida TaxID=1433469 RepID=A0A9N8YVF8_9GLOM|nr:9527_t:CDS:2 [Cetraspora pellucida]